MEKRGFSTILALILVALVLIGGYYFLYTQKTGNLAIQITESTPGVRVSTIDISKVEVVLANMEIHKGKAGEEVAQDSGWVSLGDQPVTYDLVALKNVKKTISTNPLSLGKYNQIRFSIKSVKATINGVEQNIAIPDETTTLETDLQITENHNSTLTLDFNGEDSVRNEAGTYVVKPVINLRKSS